MQDLGQANPSSHQLEFFKAVEKPSHVLKKLCVFFLKTFGDNLFKVYAAICTFRDVAKKQKKTHSIRIQAEF